MYKIIFYCFLLFIGQSLKASDEKLHEVVYSPDKKYTAQYIDTKVYVKSKDKEFAFDVFPLEYPIKWSKDSKTIILIEHIAHGSYATIVRPEETGNIYYDANPPKIENVHGYSVVKMDIGSKSIKLTYKVSVDEKNNQRGFYACTFDYDFDTKTISNIAKQKIDLDTYISLKLK